MPLNDQYSPWAAPSQVVVWEATEPAAFFEQKLPLSPTEQRTLAQRYPHTHARRDWMASRYALQQLCGQHCSSFYKDTAGKLRVPNTPLHYSISHSGAFAAAIQSNTPVGIDVQIPNSKLQRIAHKYIEPAVLEQLKSSVDYIDYLHYYWGIKEALFKAYGKGRVNFIDHLHLLPFPASTQGHTYAQLIKPDEQHSYTVFYKKTADYYLCVATERF